jgi:hypothetical protein
METRKLDIEKKRKAAQKLDILEKREKKNFGTEIFPQLILQYLHLCQNWFSNSSKGTFKGTAG